MNIGLQTWGSDGDIRPFAALAGALAERGHRVTLAVTSVDGKDYQPLARALGFTLIATPPPDVDAQAIARGILRLRDPLWQTWALFRRALAPGLPAITELSRALVRDNDLLVTHPLMFPLMALAEKAGKRYATVFFCPGPIPSVHLPPMDVPNLGTWANRILWKLGAWITDPPLRSMANRFRRAEGLPPLKNLFPDGWISPTLNLVAVSPVLFPPPPDWKGRHHLTGFFNVPERADTGQWGLPEALPAFLDSGPPPVYFTFGSMTQFDPQSSLRLMLEAARRVNARAIIQADPSVIGAPVSENVYWHSGPAPHSAIFPKCAAIVHHGGSGTTQASVRAGAPSVAVPHGFDQPYWGWLLHKRGLGGQPISRWRATPEKLAAEINRVLANPSIRANARAAAARLAGEDGPRRAAELIETLIR